MSEVEERYAAASSARQLVMVRAQQLADEAERSAIGSSLLPRPRVSARLRGLAVEYRAAKQEAALAEARLRNAWARANGARS